ncbi:fumarylacetoacetate hydrolase family protein [Actinomadura vinacea]|uniref:Fumarylacetoacetate hydrolase family protein n=1 Tax=Actinomadura vinacea TaxID=115336 RepID=A0ABN3JPC6_9ACTN
MRLVGFMNNGRRWIGELHPDGVRPIDDVEEYFRNGADTAPRGEFLDPATLEPAPPVPATAKVFCVGLNYRAHAEEVKVSPVDAVPTVFGRWASTLSCDGADVPVPPGEGELDWEGELAAIIGRPLLGAGEDESLAAVLGWTCFNDLSARRLQTRTPQWTLGKNGDLTAPMGPAIVADAGFDHRAQRLVTRVNGKVVQDADTADMIFSPGQVLAHISQALTVQPGDVVALGTPSGVGASMTPPRAARPGDVVEVEISGIGTLRNRLTPARPLPDRHR